MQSDGENVTGPMPHAGSGKIIAVYRGGTVTEEEFSKYIGFMSLMNQEYMNVEQYSPYQKTVLKPYIGHKVLASRLGEMSDEAKKILDTQVDTFYAYVKQAAEVDTALNKRMEEAGLSDSDIKYFFRLITAVGDAEVNKITDDAVMAIFEETRMDYYIVTLRHILVGTTDMSAGEVLRTEEAALHRIQEVKTKLEAGGDWHVLAKAYSDDPGSSDNGGLYEWQTAGGFITEFKHAVNEQAVGEIGVPVKTPYGYHVIQVEQREEISFEKLTEDHKAAIRQMLASEAMERFMSNELEDLITEIDLSASNEEG
ncbi:foldase protein PrsA [Paenibacillus phyllosphaerae]|uniref:Foldase protein PrsA n=1 Tax=Paenibacillus phyllosphaerae TaxID=274593 RepID=A0A7W5AWK0_9BACL|nr:peptidylprolyl isomerase [Paenibacillus phyllosphaerae]MBB3110133.1 foldase protein PrsA [Paenibacillus phyllosphaerae]